MLNVTYIYTAASVNPKEETKITVYPYVTRVMTNILNNQKELNVTYSDIPVVLALLGKTYPIIDQYNFDLKYRDHIFDNLIKEIKDDIILLTVIGKADLHFLKQLLISNKKVVIGGPLTKIYDSQKLREVFKVNGFKNLHNLLIVCPHIDRNINLFKIIEEWKDIDETTSSKLCEIFNSDEDFYFQFKDLLWSNKLNCNFVGIMTQDSCSWRKCKFCHIGKNNIRFTCDENKELYVESLIKYMKKYSVNSVAITDPEFHFGKLQRDILDLLQQSNYNIRVFILSNIKSLNNETYFNYIFDRYKDLIKGLSIGVESLDDFALKLLGKPFKVEHYFNVLERIIKFNCNNRSKIDIRQFLMMNICNKNKEHIRNDYQNQLYVQKLLKKYDMPGLFSYNVYSPTFDSEYTINNPYIRLHKHPYMIDNTYTRIDEDGNELPDDSQIVEPSVFNQLIGWRK